MKKDEAGIDEAALLERAAVLGVNIPPDQKIPVLEGARRLSDACRLLRAFKDAETKPSSSPT